MQWKRISVFPREELDESRIQHTIEERNIAIADT